MRLGVFPKDFSLNSPIWIHAVSVGEVMAVRNLINELKQKYPDKQIVISTVTPTGNKIAETIAWEDDFVIYFPLDISFIVRAVIRKINPCLVIIAETEIWPNFLSCLYSRHIPVIAVNSRISDNSFEGYMSIQFLVVRILNKVSLFCSQTDSDAERLISLGVSRDKIKVTGNMKFDTADYVILDDRDEYMRKLSLKSNEKFWVAASTHPGEEGIILSVYKRLLADYPQLKLLIAPRHPERFFDIEKIIIGYGFKSIRLSQLTGVLFGQSNPAVFILDTIGQLMNLYKIADIVFVGGSLIKKGGHNILEPAVLAKPIIFGPYMFNFKDIAELFLKYNASILVHNRKELEKAIRDLLNSPQKRDELGRKAKALVEENKGATLKNMVYISSFIKG